MNTIILSLILPFLSFYIVNGQTLDQRLKPYFDSVGSVEKWKQQKSQVDFYESINNLNGLHKKTAIGVRFISLQDSVKQKTITKENTFATDTFATCLHNGLYYAFSQGDRPYYYGIEVAENVADFASPNFNFDIINADSVVLETTSDIHTIWLLYKKGLRFRFFLNEKTHLIDKSHFIRGNSYTHYSNYQSTNGLLLPFTETFEKDGKILITQYKKRGVNSNIDVCIFSRPVPPLYNVLNCPLKQSEK
jgi:hypothetical protein